MDLEGNWARIKKHRRRLTDEDIQGLAETLFRDRETWLGERARHREDQALALELLGCLGHKGSLQAVNQLLRCLESREEALQLAVAAELKRCPPELAIQPLAGMMLRQSQAAVKAGEVMLSFGEAGADALWRLWFGGDRPAGFKAQILRLLTEKADPRCEALAYLALMSGEEELVRTALKTAERLGYVSLWGNVAGCLGHPDWRLRSRAVLLLGQWRLREALPFLREMGRDADPWVEEERQKAIALIWD